MVLTGLAVFLGNLFPLFLKFKGGKGVATSTGIFCALNWKVLITLFAIWVVIVLVSRYVSAASITAAVLLPVCFIGYEFQDAFNSRVPVTVFAAVVAVLVVVKHRSNIKRLLNGTENKVLVKKTDSEKVKEPTQES
jgi:glycerol-3-phosphate acyltransferase PlsY